MQFTAQTYNGASSHALGSTGFQAQVAVVLLDRGRIAGAAISAPTSPRPRRADRYEEKPRVVRLRESSGKGIELQVLDALSVAANSRETVLRSLARYDSAVAGVWRAVGDRSP